MYFLFWLVGYMCVCMSLLDVSVLAFEKRSVFYVAIRYKCMECRLHGMVIRLTLFLL